MRGRKIAIFAISFLVVSLVFPQVAGAKLDSKTFNPIVINKAKGYVYFYAKVKKPEHPAGDNPLTLASPNALVNENGGTALVAAALVAEDGVNADKLTAALKALRLKPGQNIKKGEKGKIAKGSRVTVLVKFSNKVIPFKALLKAGNPNVKVKYRFLGNNEVQKQMGCGCLICGRSGPGTVLANAAYSTSDPAIIGPTLYQGLIKYGAKDGQSVKVIIRKIFERR